MILGRCLGGSKRCKMESSSFPDEANLSALLNRIQQLVPKELISPKVAIVCGSGLSTLGSAIIDRVDVPYHELPGFLASGGKCEIV